mgnify:CR=1 FL=1
MESLFRKFIKLVGPYPYNPYLIFLFFASIFFSRYAPLVILVPAGLERMKFAALLLLASVKSSVSLRSTFQLLVDLTEFLE